MLLTNPNQLLAPPKRIISLVPSLTELLSYFGLEDSVVGITKFCTYPSDWHSSKQIVGGTKNVNIAVIDSLNPDLIIANKEENTKEEIELLADKYNVWLTDIINLDDALSMIIDFGYLIKRPAKALLLKESIQNAFTKISYTPTKPISVAYLIWRKPYMVAGGNTFINSLLETCNITNVFSTHQRYPSVTIEEIKKANPDILLLSSEPYPFTNKHALELKKDLPNCKYILADGSYFSWYGSRLLQAPAYFNRVLTQL